MRTMRSWIFGKDEAFMCAVAFGDLQLKYIKIQERATNSQGRWIMRSGVQDQPDQHGKTLTLLKIQKLARCGGGCL